MGVLPSHHRQGLGRALVLRAEDTLRREGVHFFQVKTLSPRAHCPNYAKTLAFYVRLGFEPLEEILELWDKHNPCLISVKHL